MGQLRDLSRHNLYLRSRSSYVTCLDTFHTYIMFQLRDLSGHVACLIYWSGYAINNLKTLTITQYLGNVLRSRKTLSSFRLVRKIAKSDY